MWSGYITKWKRVNRMKLLKKFNNIRVKCNIRQLSFPKSVLALCSYCEDNLRYWLLSK